MIREHSSFDFISIKQCRARIERDGPLMNRFHVKPLARFEGI